MVAFLLLYNLKDSDLRFKRIELSKPSPQTVLPFSPPGTLYTGSNPSNWNLPVGQA